MTIPDPTYISAQEVIDNTLLTGLAGLDPENIEKLIKTAEQQIDSYVGPQPHHYADTTVERVFPREQDFVVEGTGSGILEYPDLPEIPANVSLACLRQVEWLYAQWWNDSATSLMPIIQEVQQEAVGGDGSYSATYGAQGMLEGKSSLCTQSKELLKGFVSRLTGISTTDTATSSPPKYGNRLILQ